MITEKTIDRFLSSLANTLLTQREKADKSLNQLSQESGVNRQTIRFIERNDHRPTCATLYRISKALDIPLWKIIKLAEEGTKQ